MASDNNYVSNLNVAHDSDLWGRACPCQIFIMPFIGRHTGFPQLAAVTGAGCTKTQNTVSNLQSEVADLRFDYHCLREIIRKLHSELMGLMTPFAYRVIQMVAEDVGGCGSPYLAVNKMIDRRSEDLLQAHTEILEIRQKYYLKKDEFRSAQKLADKFGMISGAVRNLFPYDSMNTLGAPRQTLHTSVFLNYLGLVWAEMRIHYKGLKAAQAASRNAGLHPAGNDRDMDLL